MEARQSPDAHIRHKFAVPIRPSNLSDKCSPWSLLGEFVCPKHHMGAICPWLVVIKDFFQIWEIWTAGDCGPSI